ncbi:MAG: right-handed parallel beta-helix repeat-containing protein [Candidatus Pacearchaeota archaeon]|nr:right-handed parallel beta-helix repeat-containing protein [Candidatus Pacearchaeota archaeon]
MKRYGWILVLFLAALLFALANTGAEASQPQKTIFVDSSQEADTPWCFVAGNSCKTFQFAVDIAQPGDTICLKSGSYRETRIAKESSLSCSGRISSVILERGARISGTFEVAADKVRVMSGARLQDGIDLVREHGTLSVDWGEYEPVRIRKSLTILGTPGNPATYFDCPLVAGGTTINAFNQAFGITQEGSSSVTIRDVSIKGALKVGMFARDVARVSLERVYVQTPTDAVGVYIFNASTGFLDSGSVCGFNRTGQGVVVSGSRVAVSNYNIWRQKIAIGVVGYKEYGNAQRSARGTRITENLLVLNDVGVRVEGYSEYTSISGNRFFVNGTAVQSVALNRDGFEHAAPMRTQVSSNVISGNGKGVESFVLGNGSANIKAEPVDARGNWWGTFTGPKEVVSNPRGAGPSVSGPVLFSPWCADSTCQEEFGVPERLVFLSESRYPAVSSFALTVEARDANGKLAVNFDGYVRLNGSPGCGTLWGPGEVAARDGRALFTGISLVGLQSGCVLSASSVPVLKEASSKGVFTPVLSSDPSSVALPPEIPKPEAEVSDPVLDPGIPRIGGGTSSFLTTGNWSSAALAAKLEAKGCVITSLFRIGDGEVNDYVDQLSGRVDPTFPAVLLKGTTMVVWCR